MAIVVDDLNMSFESIARIRGVLTRYVDTLVAPGDLVAILRASGGSGALQQFTTDRRLLPAAIETIRFVPRVSPIIAGSGQRDRRSAEVDALAEECYALHLPVRQPGGYQVRVAVPDEGSSAVGSAAQFVDVPTVGARRVALSGVSLHASNARAAPMTTVFAAGSTLEYRAASTTTAAIAAAG